MPNMDPEGTTAVNPPNTAGEVSPAPLSERAAGIKAYMDAETKEAKAAAVTKYPFLKEVFSEVNHS